MCVTYTRRLAANGVIALGEWTCYRDAIEHDQSPSRNAAGRDNAVASGRFPVDGACMRLLVVAGLAFAGTVPLLAPHSPVVERATESLVPARAAVSLLILGVAGGGKGSLRAFPPPLASQ